MEDPRDPSARSSYEEGGEQPFAVRTGSTEQYLSTVSHSATRTWLHARLSDPVTHATFSDNWRYPRISKSIIFIIIERFYISAGLPHALESIVSGIYT
eukprot:scaffold48280_cov15-Prasinocladus_malaysianus.AAC.1